MKVFKLLCSKYNISEETADMLRSDFRLNGKKFQSFDEYYKRYLFNEEVANAHLEDQF